MDIYPVRQGAALPLVVSLNDDNGNPITTYTGAESLSAQIWPGGDLAVECHPTVSWTSAANGTMAVLVSAVQTAELAHGRHYGSVVLVDPVYGPLEAYLWAIDVLEATASGATAPAYATFDDLLEYGAAWLPTLQTPDTDAGYSKQCGRARSWLDDIIVGSYKGYRNRGIDPDGYGPPIGGPSPSNYPSIWLRQQLAAGGLLVSDLVKEITANKALAIICQGQIGSGNKTFDFPKLGRYYRIEAEEGVKTLRAEINTDPTTGYPQFVVVCGAMDFRGT